LLIEDHVHTSGHLQENKFFSMFDSCAPVACATDPQFEDARSHLSDHQTWRLASTDEDRQDLFGKWLKKKQEKDRVAGRAALLEYLENCAWLSLETTWGEASDRLQHVPEFAHLSEFDRVDVFAEFMAKVDDRDASAKLVQKEIRLKQESRTRIALRKLFKDQLGQGVIHAKLTWKEYLQFIGSNKIIRDVEKNTSGSRPRDLFMDVIEEAERLYDAEKSDISTCLKGAKMDPYQIEASPDTVRELKDSLKGNFSASSLRLFLLEEQSKNSSNIQNQRH
jgi:pre-mRNA-processing factor 40